MTKLSNDISKRTKYAIDSLLQSSLAIKFNPEASLLGRALMPLRLAINSTGPSPQIALVPEGTREGDIICEFFESTATAVIRPITRSALYHPNPESCDLVGRALVLEDSAESFVEDRREFQAGFGTNRILPR
jgi:hypothetical protein